MEIAGAKAALKEIVDSWKLQVSAFVTDRHPQIRKWMRETFGEGREDQRQPLIRHFFDAWHIAKSKSSRA